MSQWQIDSKEYLDRLGFTIEDFEKQLKFPKTRDMKVIIPLREMQEVKSIVPISHELLSYLIRKIKTLDGQTPFRNSRVKQVIINPRQLKIGQKYVYRENYQSLLENGISDLFRDFLGEWAGLGSLGAYFVFGLDKSENYVMACYIPPIVEVHESKSLIMDGIHRNYIGRQTGLPTLNAILIKDVSVPFPCSSRSWKEIQVIPLIQKPKGLEDRYFDLQKNLFRDLKYLGIDG